MLLNIFDDAYNVCVRGIPSYWQLIISVSSLIACLFFLRKVVIKSSEKQPINWGYAFLVIVFGALSILYTI